MFILVRNQFGLLKNISIIFHKLIRKLKNYYTGTLFMVVYLMSCRYFENVI